MHSSEQAVEVAAALVMQEDATFRPEKHRARVYSECGMGPVFVDFYSDIGTYVVKRLRIKDGVVRGLSTFSESKCVTSSRHGPGMYVLDATGRVIGLLPYTFGPDGEVAGFGSMRLSPPHNLEFRLTPPVETTADSEVFLWHCHGAH